MFILNNKIEVYLNLALDRKYPKQEERIRVTVEPLEPPFIQVSFGRHTSKVKIGKLLAALALPDKQVKELVEEYKEINGDLSQFTIKYTRDYEETYEHKLYAIDSTTVSCMTDMECVKVYDYDENLELLTIWKKVDTDKKIIVGRTLVAWRNNEEEESVYVRLYLDHNHIQAHQATALAVREGFTRGNLEGIMIDKIEDNEGYLCPYLDGLDTLEDRGDHFLITKITSPYQGDSTNGYMRDGTCTCESCDARVAEADTCYINDMVICDDCVSNDYTCYEDEYYHNDNCITTSDTNETIPLDCLEEAEVKEDHDGDYYTLKNLVEIDEEWFYIGEVHKLEETYAGNDHALKEDCLRLMPSIVGATEGYYMIEQLEEKKEELEAKILELQEEISLKGDFMLYNQELKNLLTSVEVLEELL